MNTRRIKALATTLLTFAIVSLSVFGQEHGQVGPSKVRSMEIKVARARIIFLTDARPDPGPDLQPGTADDDSAGPFFVVKGDIVSLDGAPAKGSFICRGVVFTSPASPQEKGAHGVAQVSVTWDIDGRGILMGQSVEFRPDQPAGAVIGGTGEFERMLGTYTPSGAPVPLGDGNFSFTFSIRPAK